MRARGGRGAIAGALLAATIATAPALAQQVNDRTSDPVAPLFRPRGPRGAPISPLDAVSSPRPEQARVHAAGKLDKAQSELQSLLSASPHQPAVLAELRRCCSTATARRGRPRAQSARRGDPPCSGTSW